MPLRRARTPTLTRVYLAKTVTYFHAAAGAALSHTHSWRYPLVPLNPIALVAKLRGYPQTGTDKLLDLDQRRDRLPPNPRTPWRATSTNNLVHIGLIHISLRGLNQDRAISDGSFDVQSGHFPYSRPCELNSSSNHHWTQYRMVCSLQRVTPLPAMRH